MPTANSIKVRLPEVRHFAAGTILHLTFDPAHIHLFDRTVAPAHRWPEKSA